VRIGIDVSWAQGPPSGTVVYVASLVEALLRRDDATRHEWVLFTRGRPETGLFPLACGRRVRYVSVDAPLTNLRLQASLPPAIRAARLDLYHAPAYFLPLALPLFWRGPSIVGVFDLNFLRLREGWQFGRRAEYLSLSLQVPLAAHQAARVLTLSKNSAADVTRLLRVPAHKVAVIPAAPRALFSQSPDPAAVEAQRARYGRFIVYIGALSAQKNVERLVRAFALLDDPSLTLVLAGRAAGDYVERVLLPLIRRYALSPRVVFAGPVDDETLRALYHSAVALAYPSLGEGFGLPIVEAMTCGCPVVTSNLSSMPQVAGAAALLIDPYAVDDLAAALDRLSRDESLRADLARRGRIRAALYTWDAVAAQTLDLYHDVAARRPGASSSADGKD